MAIQLKVIAGADKDKGRTFDLPDQGSLHLGRGPDTDTRFNDVRVSGSHCRVYSEANRLTITDNGSTNGTFINEQQLAADELRDLVPGDVVRLGENTRLEVTGDDIAVMKTVAGNAGMLAREIAAAAAKAPPVPPYRQPTPAPMPAAGSPPPYRPSAVARPQQPAEPTVEVLCSCGQQLVAREKYAGTRVRCPNCRNILSLPGRPALAQPVADDEVPAPEAPPVASGSKLWPRLVTFAAGVLLLVAAGAFLATLFAGSGKTKDGTRKAAVEQARRTEAP
jgi:predicted component of type VI protein secretion system